MSWNWRAVILYAIGLAMVVQAIYRADERTGWGVLITTILTAVGLNSMHRAYAAWDHDNAVKRAARLIENLRSRKRSLVESEGEQ